jgi:hypothetical protein
MKVKIHGSQRNDQGGVISAKQSVVLQKTLFLNVLALGPHMLIGRQQEACGSAAGIYLMVVFDTSSICTRSPETA